MEESIYITKALKILKSTPFKSYSIEQRRKLAIDLAAIMLEEARKTTTHVEKSKANILSQMMDDLKGKAFVTSVADQCFRSHHPSRVADQIKYLIEKFKIPKFLPFFQRLQLFFFKIFGKSFSFILVPFFLKAIRKEASSVIIPGEPALLFKYMKNRRIEGISLNLNRIGEAILGEDEAVERLESYLLDLKDSEVECISVKVSTLYSQISLPGWEETLSILKDKLKKLYRAANENYYIQEDGQKIKKFVYLDMEEYRDLHITTQLFQNTLDEPEFKQYSAGIVLQSYLPESFELQQKITSWAINRVKNGGDPIKIRIVKGANMAMEQVEASLHGWQQAPYAKKIETDANYKKMVIYGCEPERAKAVFLGIASHNLFDIAFAMLLRVEKNIERYVSFEMLEGMAEPLRRVVQAMTGKMLLYSPIATYENFPNAIAYLTRRLDENTAPENFLKSAFGMVPGTSVWHEQANLFSSACDYISLVSSAPRRRQDRFEDNTLKPQNFSNNSNGKTEFYNEPDTDWSLLQNVKWIKTLIHKWSSLHIEKIPLVIGNQIIKDGLEWKDGIDPSYPNTVKYQYAIGKELEAEIALNTAEKALISWNKLTQKNRLQLIEKVASKLQEKRGDLICAMTLDTAKPVMQGDAEVSEAIDFVRYYCKCVEDFGRLKDIHFSCVGVTLVASPWNFPCSIPVGGIIAALAAGNSVIFKPAPEAVLVGWHVANAFWEAGISREVLQFFCCQDEPTGSDLIKDPRIASVILTGATATAKHILQLSPGINLFAETGGKNTMIITSLADKDLAIKDLIDSAFGYSGQKCSACSLAILEQEVYEDEVFMRKLRDAASSMVVDTPWKLSSRIIPLIRSPSPDLLHALTNLGKSEKWLLKPEKHPDHPNLWSPGIILGVKRTSKTYQTELFGPVLGIMCACDLNEAIKLANGTPYGLTAGIHTLDDREQKVWLKEIIAGNCYINRNVTGAIVGRQPFGGCKESSYGPSAKAGGPNYVLQFMQAKQVTMPIEKEPIDERLKSFDLYAKKIMTNPNVVSLWSASLGSYAYFWNHYFSKEHETEHVLGQSNTLKYVLKNNITFRVTSEDASIDVLRVIAAALTCNAALTISCWTKRDDLFNNAELKLDKSIVIIEETEEQFLDRLKNGHIEQIRMISMPNAKILEACAKQLCYIAKDPVFANGRLELLHYLREVSTSRNIHRYGYLEP